ncbi:MAG: hypothetical protein H6Q86_1172 [candidate division NC10 bacterium]|nr:hypothetical protein [candidate division NC10 bacterium]
MQRNRLAETLDTLKALERLELGLAGLYELCGGPAGSEPEFWTTLAQEERRHAEAIRRMAAIVAERPERFEPSRAFQLPSIRTFRA